MISNGTIFSGGHPVQFLKQARSLVIADQRASISYVKRKLQIGCNRAASLMEDLEKIWVVSPMGQTGTRTVIATA